jgi:hypothetical protein
MKSFWLKVVFCLVAITSHSFGEGNRQIVDFDALSDFVSAIRETKLIAIDVDIWDDEEAFDDLWITREAALQKQIGKKLKTHGHAPNALFDRAHLPGYQKFKSFYDEQFDNSAYLNVSIYKKHEKILVDLTCWKNSSEFQIPIFARTFSYIVPEVPDEEDEDAEWWWVIIQDKVLNLVDEFLKDFSAINPGPYGWTLPH